MRPQRTCIECGALHRNPGPRCGPHQRQADKVRNAAPNKQPYTQTWYRRLRTQVRAGQWGPCRSCGSWADLTVDHVQPISKGGEHGPLTVLCRSCNSRKGASVEKR